MVTRDVEQLVNEIVCRVENEIGNREVGRMVRRIAAEELQRSFIIGDRLE